jgi:DNA invertase Pin-like site-specific DNA recombinase
MQFGYARVSTTEQGKNGYSLDGQIEALKAAGCERVFSEVASGGKAERPELMRLKDQLRKDDVLVVYKLDRLSRSLRDLLLFLEEIKEIGAQFRSLTEDINTTTAAGVAMMQMIGVFAEFERSLIRERTKEGLAIARLDGKVGGRPLKLDERQRCEIVKQIRLKQKSAADCARLFNISPATVSRIVAKAKEQRGESDGGHSAL